MFRLAIISCLIAQSLSAPSGCLDLCGQTVGSSSQTSGSLTNFETHGSTINSETVKDLHNTLVNELSRDYNRPGNWTEANDYKLSDGTGKVHEERGQVVGAGGSKMRYYKQHSSYAYSSGNQSGNSGFRNIEDSSNLQQNSRVNSRNDLRQSSSLYNEQHHQSEHSSKLEDLGERVDTSLNTDTSRVAGSADNDNWRRHNTYLTDGGHGKVHEEEGQYTHGPAKVRYYKKNYTSSYSSGGVAPVVSIPDFTTDLRTQAQHVQSQLDQISRELHQGHHSQFSHNANSHHENNYRDTNSNEYQQRIQNVHNEHHQIPSTGGHEEHYEEHSSRREHRINSYGGNIPTQSSYVTPDEMQTAESHQQYEQVAYQPSGQVISGTTQQYQGQDYQQQSRGYYHQQQHQQQQQQQQQHEGHQHQQVSQTNTYQHPQRSQVNGYEQHQGAQTDAYQQQQRSQGYYHQSEDRQSFERPDVTQGQDNSYDYYRNQHNTHSQQQVTQGVNTGTGQTYTGNERTYQDGYNQYGGQYGHSQTGRHVEEQWSSTGRRVEETNPHQVSGNSQRLDNFDDLQRNRGSGVNHGESSQYGGHGYRTGSSSTYHQRYESHSGGSNVQDGHLHTGVIDLGHGSADCDTEQTGSRYQRRYRRDLSGQSDEVSKDHEKEIENEGDHERKARDIYGPETQQFEDFTQLTQGFQDYTQQQNQGRLTVGRPTLQVENLSQQTQKGFDDGDTLSANSRYRNLDEPVYIGSIGDHFQGSAVVHSTQLDDLQTHTDMLNKRYPIRNTSNLAAASQHENLEDFSQLATHRFDDYYRQQPGNIESSQQHEKIDFSEQSNSHYGGYRQQQSGHVDTSQQHGRVEDFSQQSGHLAGSSQQHERVDDFSQQSNSHYGGYRQQQSGHVDTSQQHGRVEDFSQQSGHLAGSSQQHERVDDFSQQSHNHYGGYRQQQSGHLDSSQQHERVDDFSQESGHHADSSQQHERVDDFSQQSNSHYGAYNQQSGHHVDSSQQHEKVDDFSQQSNSHYGAYNQQSGHHVDSSQQHERVDNFSQQSNNHYGAYNQQSGHHVDSSQQHEKVDDFSQQSTGHYGGYRHHQSGNIDVGSQQGGQGYSEFENNQHSENFGQHTGYNQQTHDVIQENVGLENHNNGQNINSYALKPAPKPVPRSQRIGSTPRSDIEPDTQPPFGTNTEIRPVTSPTGVKNGRGREFSPQSSLPNQYDSSSSGVLSLEDQHTGSSRQSTISADDYYQQNSRMQSGYSDDFYSNIKRNTATTPYPTDDFQSTGRFRDVTSEEIVPGRVQSLETQSQFQSQTQFPEVISTTPAPGFWKKVGQKITSGFEKAKEKVTTAFG